MKFEEKIKKIDEITKKLESVETGLDEAVALYDEAIKSSKDCMTMLSETKGKIEIINKEFIKIENSISGNKE